MFASITTALRRRIVALRAWAAPLAEWPFWVLLALLFLGIGVVAQQPLHYVLDIGYEEGWRSDRPLINGWNTGEPEHATADELSYRWTAEDSQVRLPGLGRQTLVVKVQQLAAAANPQAPTGVLRLSAGTAAVSLPLTSARTAYMLLPPEATGSGELHLGAPTFTPPGDPRTLGVPVAQVDLVSTSATLTVPPVGLFWPLLLLPLAWSTARRWCLTLRSASVAGLGLVGLLLFGLASDRLRFALAGGPLLWGAIWGLLVGLFALWLTERYARRLGIQPSAWLVRAVALLIFWLMLLRYGGRLYPESMIGDLGFHVNRQNEVLHGLIHLTSLHRGIAFPYPSAVYILLAPLRLLPIDPYALIEWSDALFGALGPLPIAYIALRSLRDERKALLITATYACLAPAMMALWWSFLSHIFSQEALVLLIAVLIGAWHQLHHARGIMLLAVMLSLVFFGHFGLYINISLLLGGLLPLLWWRFRGTPEVHSVYGLALALVIAEVLALGLFYSAYLDLITQKLSEFSAGGMGAVQGGRAAISRTALLRSLWRDGLVDHYAIVGVPLGVIGSYMLWRRTPHSLLAYLLWGTLGVAILQAAIPFMTSSTISTRWLSFCAWVVAVGGGVALDWLWRRGRLGQTATLMVLMWIGGNTLWLWVQALGYRIRPPEPF